MFVFLILSQLGREVCYNYCNSLTISYFLPYLHFQMNTEIGRRDQMNKREKETQIYIALLKQYLQNPQAGDKDEIKKMSSTFIDEGIYPEEIIRMHMDALQKLYDDVSGTYHAALTFLLQSFIAYREAYVQYDLLKTEQLELKSEIQVAANMQQTLLATEIPHLPGLDIGAITVPHHQLNGDYIHFVTGKDGAVGVAIADVIGKGVPAALSMSMIKYALDSFYEETMSPSAILRDLNRVVERNVSSNMFITMFYGQYFTTTNTFRFSTAGHEPGFIYRKETGDFSEIEAKGLVLGVLKHTKYKQYELHIEEGDLIVLLTDGVTECRHGDGFVTREAVLDVIAQYMHLPVQDHVEQVYRHFKELDDFELKDDFSLIIMKRNV